MGRRPSYDRTRRDRDRASAARHVTPVGAQLSGGRASLLRPSRPTPPRSPRAPRRVDTAHRPRSPGASRRRSPCVARSLAAPGRRRSTTVAAVRRRRASTMEAHASCSTATPGSAPGWRSRSTSRTTGPPITGELRLAGGTQGQTRFGTPVDLPTQSDKTHRPVRPAAGLRARARDQPRRRAHDDRHDQGAVHDPRRDPAGRRRRRRAARATRRRPRPAAQQNNVSAADRRPRRRRPAGPGRGMGRARPARLAGHRLRAPRQPTSSTRCAAGSPAAAGWSSSAGPPVRPACRRSPTRSCPTARRPPPTSRPRRSPACSASCPTDATDLPALSGELTRAGRWRRRRPGRRRRAGLRQRRGHDPRLRPDGRLDRRHARRPRACGAA